MSAPRRALLVIDVQNEYFDGELPIVYPPLAESLPNIIRAMAAARSHRVPVVVIQHSAAAGAPIFTPGSSGWQLHPQVAAFEPDLLVCKAKPSVFTGTGLGEWLAERAIDTVSVLGYMTHNCNASSVYEAFHRGLRVEVLGDASGALPYANSAGRASAEEIHRVLSVVFHSNFASVVSTAQWIEALRCAAPLPLDNVLQSSQRGRSAA